MKKKIPGANHPGEQEVNRHTMQTCNDVCDSSNKSLCPIKNRRSPRGRELQAGIDICMRMISLGKTVDEVSLFEELPGRRYRGKNCLSVIKLVARDHPDDVRMVLEGGVWHLARVGVDAL